MEKKCLQCNKPFKKPYHESLSNWNKRHKFCSKQCCDKYKVNKPLSKDTRSKIADGLKQAYKNGSRVNTFVGKSKEKAYNWKGGITELMYNIRHSSEYVRWRISVYRRDRYTCRICGKHCEKKSIVAHHLKFLSVLVKEYNIKTIEDALSCPELWDTDNGTTLCRRCHLKIHKA